MDLLFPGTRQRVLAILLLQPDAGFHLRELARKTGTNPGTLARELDKLTEAGLLRRSEIGNQQHYQANVRHPLFPELAGIFRKTHGALPMLREALAPLGPAIRLALVFGSVARGSETAGSDIDLLVIGDTGFAEVVRVLYPLQQQLAKEINPVVYSPVEFRARVAKGEVFARELMDRPNVFLIGDKDDFAELAGDQPPADPPG